MRLLSTYTADGLRLENFIGDVPDYAILSHKWNDQEVSYEDVKSYRYEDFKGYGKLVKACERAAEDGFEWIWVDTCCIDKSSSAELSEAINSMYDWYARAVVCYALLDDYDEKQGLEHCRWFNRGWTLQELIAPKTVEFYDNAWNEVGTKRSLRDSIASITGVNTAVLDGSPPSTCTYAERMSWMCGRRTTREEDIAYCLLGLCEVNMPLLYGEGAKKAFFRLQAEILSATEDHTLLMWDHRAVPPTSAADGDTILAPAPWLFKRVGNLSERQYGRDELAFDYSQVTVENAVEYRSKWIQNAAKANISAGTLNIRPQELGLQAWVAEVALDGSSGLTQIAILNAWVGDRPVFIRLQPHEQDKSGRHYRRGPGAGFEVATQAMADGWKYKQMRLRSISLYPARLTPRRTNSLPEPDKPPTFSLQLETLSGSITQPHSTWKSTVSPLTARFGPNDRGLAIIRFEASKTKEAPRYLIISYITQDHQCWLKAEVLSALRSSSLVQLQKAQLQSTERGVPIDAVTGAKWTDRARFGYAGKSLRCAIRCLSSSSPEKGRRFQIRINEDLEIDHRDNAAQVGGTDSDVQSTFGPIPMIYDGDAWTWATNTDATARTSAMERAASPSILLGESQDNYAAAEHVEPVVRRYTDENLNGLNGLKRADTLQTTDKSERVDYYDPSPTSQEETRSNWPDDQLQRVVRAREIAHKLAKRAKKQGIHGAIAEASSLVQNNFGPSSFGINGPPSLMGGSTGSRAMSNSDTASMMSGSTSGLSRLKAKKELREMKKLARSQTTPIPEHEYMSPQQSYPPQPSYAMQQWYQSQDVPPPPSGAPPMPPRPMQTSPQISQSAQSFQTPQAHSYEQMPLRQAPPIPDGSPPPYQQLSPQHSF